MRVVLLTALAMIAFSAPTMAVTGRVNDPRDTFREDHLDGPATYDPLDIATVAVAYDAAAGSVRLTLSFYGPVPSEPGGQETYAVAVGQRDFDSCAPAGVWIRAPLPETSYGASVTVDGYVEEIPSRVTVSADRREIVVEAAHRVLAGRDLNCTTRGTIGAEWGRGCNEHRCWQPGQYVADRHAPVWLGAPPRHCAGSVSYRAGVLTQRATALESDALACPVARIVARRFFVRRAADHEECAVGCPVRVPGLGRWTCRLDILTLTTTCRAGEREIRWRQRDARHA